MKQIHRNLNHGIPTERLILAIKELTRQIKYMKRRRGIGNISGNVGADVKIFYLALTHCANLLNVAVNAEQQKISSQNKFINYLNKQLVDTVKLLPKQLPKQPFISEG